MTTTINTPNLDLNQLIEGLRREDDRNPHLTNRFKWIMWVFAPLYFIFFLIICYLKFNNLEWRFFLQFLKCYYSNFRLKRRSCFQRYL